MDPEPLVQSDRVRADDGRPRSQSRVSDKINSIKDIINNDVYVKPANKTFVKHISVVHCVSSE